MKTFLCVQTNCHLTCWNGLTLSNVNPVITFLLNEDANRHNVKQLEYADCTFCHFLFLKCEPNKKVEHNLLEPGF